MANMTGTALLPIRRVRVGGFAMAVSLLLTGGWAWAADGTLQDPTLPAPAWLAAQPKPGATNSTPAANAESVEQKSGLQMIITGPGRRFAIVDGQVVTAGSSYNGAKVVAITPNEVVVEGQDKSLKVAPDVQKKLVQPAPDAHAKGTHKHKHSVKRIGGNS